MCFNAPIEWSAEAVDRCHALGYSYTSMSPAQFVSFNVPMKTWEKFDSWDFSLASSVVKYSITRKIKSIAAGRRFPTVSPYLQYWYDTVQ